MEHELPNEALHPEFDCNEVNREHATGAEERYFRFTIPIIFGIGQA